LMPNLNMEVKNVTRVLRVRENHLRTVDGLTPNNWKDQETEFKVGGEPEWLLSDNHVVSSETCVTRQKADLVWDAVIKVLDDGADFKACDRFLCGKCPHAVRNLGFLCCKIKREMARKDQVKAIRKREEQKVATKENYPQLQEAKA